MKKLSLVLTLVVLACGFTMAQRTISGTISDTSGEPLIGASILVKGTSSGTVTDIDGKYTLSVPDGSNTLIISYTGFATQEVAIGNSTLMDITLAESAEVLSEVVVTGLGIKKEKKALGYGVSTLDAADIENRVESDVARILRGKATGVDITQTSGMAGSGTNVIIRGYSSITGTNQPLFVIDGIPFNTETNTVGGFTQGGAAASSRFLDLDPNNIAEVSILKGLSATVLYGEAGRNGVILITTKNRAAGDNTADKKFEVSVTQQVASSSVANLPDYQNTYGNGFNGNFGWFFSNWGPSFDTRGSNGIAEDGTIEHPYDQAQYNDDFPEFIGVRYPYQPYESVENFFQPGLTSNTSVSLQNNLGNGSSISATYSYLSDEGFTPDLDEMRGGGPSNFLNKHNFGLGGRTELSNGLKINATFNYVDSESRLLPTGPAFGGDGEGFYAALVFTPRSIDLMNLPYQSPLDGSNVYYRRGSAIQNPRWTLNNSSFNDRVRRFFSTVELSYELTPWLNALYRLGLDQYTQNQEQAVNRGGPQRPDGRLQSINRFNNITDQVFNLLYNFKLGENFDLDGLIGFNSRREVGRANNTISTNQFVYGLLNHGNFIDHLAFSGFGEENTLGVYGTATLGYKSYAYLNVQARNDWTSTLEQANRSLLYPSVSFSFIPTEAIPGLQSRNFLNYLKLRVGYGTSAGYPDPYQTRNFLGTGTRSFVTGGGSVLNTNTVSDQLGNALLAPELHTEIEFGVEGRFLDNRIGVDLSLFNKNSRDVIVGLPIDPATGFTTTTVNAAEIENRGIELGLDITPIRGAFTWDFKINYTRLRNEVLAIADGVDQVRVAGYNAPGNYAIVGEPYGVIFGSAFARTPSGALAVNSVGGYDTAPDNQVIGNPQPNFTANWINNFSWKGFSFGFQWDYIDGGDIFSSTVQALMARGNTIDTDVDRFLPIIQPGELPDGTPNNIQIYMGDEFFSTYFGANEGGIFDATVIRLREVSLAYVVPASALENSPFGRISITLAGQNLFYNAPNFPVGINFDPEVLSLGVGNGRGIDFRTGPTAKKIGVTVNATF